MPRPVVLPPGQQARQQRLVLHGGRAGKVGLAAGGRGEADGLRRPVEEDPQVGQVGEAQRGKVDVFLNQGQDEYARAGRVDLADEPLALRLRVGVRVGVRGREAGIGREAVQPGADGAAQAGARLGQRGQYRASPSGTSRRRSSSWPTSIPLSVAMTV
jgi:hypothetical protein